jgi:hypothetical protein
MERNQSHRDYAFLVSDHFARKNLTRFTDAVGTYFKKAGGELILDELNPNWLRQSDWQDEAGFQFRCCLVRWKRDDDRLKALVNQIVDLLNKEFTGSMGPTIRYFTHDGTLYAEVTYITSRTPVSD